VTFKEAGSKVAKTRYPRVVASQGEAPAQYPEADEDDGPVWGYNLTTGEKILLSK
jgi:hypothetical protein